MNKIKFFVDSFAYSWLHIYRVHSINNNIQIHVDMDQSDIDNLIFRDSLRQW